MSVHSWYISLSHVRLVAIMLASRAQDCPRFGISLRMPPCHNHLDPQTFLIQFLLVVAWKFLPWALKHRSLDWRAPAIAWAAMGYGHRERPVLGKGHLQSCGLQWDTVTGKGIYNSHTLLIPLTSNWPLTTLLPFCVLGHSLIFQVSFMALWAQNWAASLWIQFSGNTWAWASSFSLQTDKISVPCD